MEFALYVICVLVQYSISVPIDNHLPCNTEDEITESISPVIQEMPAVGRVADLGDLYDARSNNFMEISLYTKKINRSDKDVVHLTDSAHVKFSNIHTELISEKIDKLGISGELSVSILSEMLKVTGSGKYITENRKKSKSIKMSLLYSSKTKEEHLKIFSNKSITTINKYLLTNIDATHVVVGLVWGANAVLSLENTDTDSFNSQNIGAELKGYANVIVVAGSGEVGFDLEESALDKNKFFSISLDADIIPNTIPQTINESITFIRNIPRLIKNENNGKGKIVRYILMPIATVRQIYKCETYTRSNENNGVMNELKKKLIDQIIQIFQEMMDSNLKINDVYNDLAKWTSMVPENKLQEITDKKSEFDLFFKQLKKYFSVLILQYRHGKSSAEDLNALISGYHKSHWIPTSVDQLLQIYEPVLRRIRLLDLFERFNARFVDKKTDKHEMLAVNYHQEIRIVSLNLNIDLKSDYVRKIVALFETEMGKGSDPESNSKPITNSTGDVEKEKGSDSKDKSKPILFYIEDDPNCSIPYITAYLKGQIIDSYFLNKTEYVLLISSGGDVTIIDATSYKTKINFKEIEFQYLIFAVVNETIYSIDTRKGYISSTHVKNLLAPSKDSIKWEQIVSFPSGNTSTTSNTAVNGSSFYFISSNGDLYKYDTTLKTLARKVNIIEKNCSYASSTSSMIVFKGLLFINTNKIFCYFDGVKLEQSSSPKQSSTRSGLFESKLGLCRVGNQEVAVNEIECYNLTDETWFNQGFINDPRDCPGIATTQFGILIFGGSKENKSDSSDSSVSVENFNDDTWTSGYIPTPPSMVYGCYFAFSFWN